MAITIKRDKHVDPLTWKGHIVDLIIRPRASVRTLEIGGEVR